MAFKQFMVSATYLPNLEALEQQTAWIAVVEFINFSVRLSYTACKLYPPFFVEINANPRRARGPNPRSPSRARGPNPKSPRRAWNPRR